MQCRWNCAPSSCWMCFSAELQNCRCKLYKDTPCCCRDYPSGAGNVGRTCLANQILFRLDGRKGTCRGLWGPLDEDAAIVCILLADSQERT
jgi:hypothetical protein